MQAIDGVITKLGLDGWDNFQPLKDVCQKVKISRPAYLVFAVLVVSVAMIIIGLAESLLVSLLGILYPAYQSIKAIQSDGGSDDKQWLTYWIVFSLTTVIDSNLGCILAFIPFYHFIKLCFYVALFHPKINGATVVYDQVIAPLYQKYGGQIDSELEKLKQKAAQKAQEAFKHQ